MIPFLDLNAQYQSIKSEIDSAVGSVIESSQFILGSEVQAFEEEFAAYCQTDFAIGVNSGTSALHLALLSAGIGPGDEVITVPATFVATVAAILYTGAKPVFVDVNPRTYTMNTDQIIPKITKRTKALLPVHLYGHPADMGSIMRIAREYGLVVIEDAAQAHGAEFNGQKVGSIGDLGCFSFYPGKNLGAYGEGGAVTTRNQEFTKTIRMLRDWGAERKYHHDLRGFNYRMEGIQGAVLRVKLRNLNSWNVARREKAKIYNELLQGLDIQLPQVESNVHHVFHIYALLLEKRDDLVRFLYSKGINTNIHYPIPVHLQKAYKDLSYKVGSFPIAESIFRRQISLPIFPELSREQCEEVARAIRDYVKNDKE
jgi:dTDP-4-amino-4,6-dideoxygalactose transaminase